MLKPRDMDVVASGEVAAVIAALMREIADIKQHLEYPGPAITTEGQDWLTLDEVAAKIGRSKRYVQEQVANGTLLSVEPGKISKRHYARWLEARDLDAETRAKQPHIIPATTRPKRRSGRKRAL